MQSNDPKSENAAMKERASRDKDRQGRQHNTTPHPNRASPGTTSNNDASQPATSRFEKFASTQAGGDGIEGDVLKPDKTTEERLGANMADRK
ncbi:MAG: hypothetical protein QOK23_4634 [Gammaproteobacteria bacterium]|jgi:hypothetical protein|nr:hypothetical protein [Gammaproteobacteria bacterium]